MAKKRRPCFMLERDQKTIIDELDNKEAGIIFKAIYEYETTGEEPKLNKSLRIVFKQFKVKLDYYNEEYEEKCRINKENAEKRWQKYNDAIEYDRIQSYAMDTNKRKEKKKKENKIKEEVEEENATHVASTPPLFTLSEVLEYGKEKDASEEYCEKFYKYYTKTKKMGEY